MKFDDCHVEWQSLEEVFLYMETAAYFIRQTLGMNKGEVFVSIEHFDYRISFY